MSALVNRHPGLCLLVLAMVLAVAPIGAVSLGWLPQGATQLGALSASLAGIILAAVERGGAGVRELLARVLVWRVGRGWWLFALLFPIIPSVAALHLYAALGGPAVDWSTLKPIASVVPMILILTVFAGLGEEFGWRGYLLPRFQAGHGALASSLMIGLLWGIWHTPLFLTPGTSQSEWLQQGGWLVAAGSYIVFCMAWSVQYTWVFNNTRGSVLLAAVIHGAGNAWIGGYIDVYRGHLGGILAFAAIMVGVSAAIVLIAGPENLSRTRARNVIQR